MDLKEKILFVYKLYDFQGMQSIPYNTLCLLFRSSAKGLSKICSPDILSLNISLQDNNQVDCLSNPFSPLQYCDTVLLTNYDIVLEYCCSHPIILSWLKFFTPNENNVPQGIFRGYDELGLRNVPQSTYAYPVQEALEQHKEATSTSSSDFDNYYTPSVRAVAVQVAKFEKQDRIVVEKEQEKEERERKRSCNEEKGEEEGKGEEENMRKDLVNQIGQENEVTSSSEKLNFIHVEDDNEKKGEENEGEKEDGIEKGEGEGEEKGGDIGVVDGDQDNENVEKVISENENDDDDENNIENESEIDDIDQELLTVDVDGDGDIDVDVDEIVVDDDDLSQEGEEEGEGEGEEVVEGGDTMPTVIAKLLKTPYPFDSIDYNK